jgi:hypothetical protein
VRYVQQSRLVGIGFVGGFATGLVLWAAQVQRSRRDLFNRSAVRRLAALGYLRAYRGIETARLLQDYVKWERSPALRKRGQLMLRRMEAYLH